MLTQKNPHRNFNISTTNPSSNSHIKKRSPQTALLVFQPHLKKAKYAHLKLIFPTKKFLTIPTDKLQIKLHMNKHRINIAIP